MIPIEIPTEIAKGELSEVIFEVLKEYGRKYPSLYYSQQGILEKVKKKLPKASLNSDHAVLQRWHDSNFLERSPFINNKGYSLKDPTIDKRPVTAS